MGIESMVFKPDLRILADNGCSAPGSYVCGDKCCLMLQTDVIISCPPHYNITAENKCEMTQEIDPTFTCPDGSIEDSQTGECLEIKIRESTQECPAGKTICPDNPLFCCGDTYTVTDTICQPGETLIAGECIKVVQADYGCDSDEIYFNGNCWKRTATEPSVQFCPNGSTMIDGECQFLSTIVSSYTCPEGYFYQESEHNCYQAEYAIPDYICSEGTQIGHECVIEAGLEAIPFCMNGWTYDATRGRCVTGRTVDVESVCPPSCELTDENQCACYMITPSDNVCPDNWQRVGNECQYIESRAPRKVCNIGWTLVGDTCQKKRMTDTFHNSIDNDVYTEAFHSCPDHYEPHPSDPSQCFQLFTTLKQNKCKLPYIEVEGKCIRYSSAPATKYCPLGWELSPDHTQCLQKITEDPILLCPATYELVGTMCEPV